MVHVLAIKLLDPIRAGLLPDLDELAYLKIRAAEENRVDVIRHDNESRATGGAVRYE